MLTSSPTTIAAVNVVPIPRRDSSAAASSWIRLFAPRAIASSLRSGGMSASTWLPNSSVAICDATSPARAPPIPSATAKKGGSSRSESSFEFRCRPTSLLPALSMMLSAIAGSSLLVAVLAVAYPDQVGNPQLLGRLQLPAVQVSAVGGPHVLDIHEVSPREDSRMCGGGERVVHRDVRRLRPAQGRS